MAVLEVAMLTGFQPDASSLDKLIRHTHLKMKRYEVDGRKVLFYFDEVFDCLYFYLFAHNILAGLDPFPLKQKNTSSLNSIVYMAISTG